jgi:hypothetical protein
VCPQTWLGVESEDAPAVEDQMIELLEVSAMTPLGLAAQCGGMRRGGVGRLNGDRTLMVAKYPGDISFPASYPWP